jgi:hypothetical protein
MRSRCNVLTLGVVAALAVSGGAGTAGAKTAKFICVKAVSAKDARTIFGASTKFLVGGDLNQCRAAPKGFSTVSVGVGTVPSALYAQYRTNYKTGTTPHGTGGARTEIVSRNVSISGAKAFQAEVKNFHDSPAATPDLHRYVFAYKKGRLLTVDSAKVTGPVPSLKRLVALARKYAAKL